MSLYIAFFRPVPEYEIGKFARSRHLKTNMNITDYRDWDASYKIVCSARIFGVGGINPDEIQLRFHDVDLNESPGPDCIVVQP